MVKLERPLQMRGDRGGRMFNRRLLCLTDVVGKFIFGGKQWSLNVWGTRTSAAEERRPKGRMFNRRLLCLADVV